MSKRWKATLFAEDFAAHPSDQYQWVADWLARWGKQITVHDYSTGGSEHLWDVSGPARAIAEIPEDLLCGSDWAGDDGRTPVQSP